MWHNLARLTLLSLIIIYKPIFAHEFPKIIVSIKPLHSLVSNVTTGVSKPVLILQGNISPHEYNLKFSDIQAIHQSDVIFWIGPDLEHFLIKPLSNTNIISVPLIESSGLELLSIRQGGIWEQKNINFFQDQSKSKNLDPHIWLDPLNAIAMVKRIITVLCEIDPLHRTNYNQNGAALIRRLLNLHDTLSSELMPIKDKAYIVFHDAYQYFEKRYSLKGVGSVAISPEQMPGIRRINTIRKSLQTLNVRCVFSDPLFHPSLVDSIIAGSNVRSGVVLDPLGFTIQAGPEAYFLLIQALVNDLFTCLNT